MIWLIIFDFIVTSILVAAGVVTWLRVAEFRAVFLAERKERAAGDQRQIDLLGQLLAVEKGRRATAERTEAHLRRLTSEIEDEEDPEAGAATEAFVWGKDRQQ